MPLDEVHIGAAIPSEPAVVVTADDMKKRFHYLDSPDTTLTAAPAALLGLRANKPDGSSLKDGVGLNCDPQIAASNSYLIVDCSENVGFYDKNGTPLMFTKIWDFMAPLGIQPPPVGWFFDNRVLYDDYRRRFWISSMAYPGNGAKPRMLTAVSQTEDPRGGWYFYWHYGIAPDCPTCSPARNPTDLFDFQQIGISRDRFFETHNVVAAAGGVVYNHVNHYDANSAAAGTGMPGWQWWDLAQPDGAISWYPQPIKQHGQTTSEAFMISRQWNTTDKMILWRLSNAQGNPGGIVGASFSLGPLNNDPVDVPQPNTATLLKYNHLGTSYNQPHSATWQGNILTVATHSAPSGLNVLHLIQIQTATNTVLFNTTFGAAGFHYGYPAIDANAAGEVGIVFNRGNASTYQEIRYSTLSGGVISGSILLKAGVGSLDNGGVAPWVDLNEASVDRIDGTMWVTSEYTTSTNAFHQWIGRVRTH